jgi:Fur family transcriptional regulator, peroxide stress response regulator
MKDHGSIITRLKESGLRITPQRVAILEAVHRLMNHPRAEQIIRYTQNHHPHIAVGTVYKVLDYLVEHGLIQRVKTEGDTMRYDPVPDRHHHLYCEESDRIEDYVDSELDALIMEHFRSKGIPHFQIKDIRLQITGNFNQNP